MMISKDFILLTIWFLLWLQKEITCRVKKHLKPDFTVQKDSVKTFLHFEFSFMCNIKSHIKFKSKLEFKSVISSMICGLWSVGHI